MTGQFKVADVRRFWSEARAAFKIDVVNRPAERFFDIVDEIWREASAEAPPPDVPATARAPRGVGLRRAGRLGLVLMAGAGRVGDRTAVPARRARRVSGRWT